MRFAQTCANICGILAICVFTEDTKAKSLSSPVSSGKMAKHDRTSSQLSSYPPVLVLQIFGGWVATLVVAGVSAGIMTAVLVYSPNKLMSDDRVYANKALNAESLAMVNLAGGATGPLGVRYPLLELWSNHLCWAYMLVIQLLLCCMHCLAHSCLGCTTCKLSLQ